MRKRLFYDTETCGLHGMATLIQYAIEDGPIILWNVWKEPIQETIDLIESFMEHIVIGFNLSYDHFHLSKIYTTWLLAREKFGGEAFPEHYINDIAILEKDARDGPCIKPFKSLDLMLYARKTEFQMTMGRKDIIIKKVPTPIAHQLAKWLNKNVELPSILFARQSKLGAKFKVIDVELPGGEISPDFKHILLKFKASAALKALAVHALNIPPEEVLTFGVIEPSKFPTELGYAPFALAVSRPEWGWKASVKLKKSKGKSEEVKKSKTVRFAWPAIIHEHISHWYYNEQAKKYASDDIKYTRLLYEYFGSPEAGDDDSELACMVGAVRWRGYAVDLDHIRKLREEAVSKIGKHPISARKVKAYINEVLSLTERTVCRVNQEGTGKLILQEIATWKPDDCPFGPCSGCDNTGKLVHPAVARAQGVLDSRFALKEIELYDKLLLAGRLHADFSVIGALSSRMSGRGGLNMQGINKQKKVRKAFTLAWPDMDLYGGDFDGFEVTLADAAYHDLILRRDLLTCETCRDPATAQFGPCPKCGSKEKLKIHALFGVNVYLDMNYDQILATKGTIDDRYTRSKSAVFALIYGGEGYTLQTRLGVEREVADKAYELFCEQYPEVKRARIRIINMFCSMKQEGGLGSRITYSEPADYIESLLGFRRYFTLENRIVKSLFELAQKPPRQWQEIKLKVQRRDRIQTASGATQSALYAAAFALQSANTRAAANHEIQSSGAQITKKLQRNIWELQPYGVHEWYVQPCNVHDEILCPTKPSVADKLKTVVRETVESFRPKVPLIGMDWTRMGNWSEK